MRRISIQLTNGKKHICRICKGDLVSKEMSLCMTQFSGNEKINVTKSILYCTKCKQYYVTQEMCRTFVREHPGYYLDLAARKDRKKKADIFTVKPASQSASERRERRDQRRRQQKTRREDPTVIYAKVFRLDTALSSKNTCPFCNSTLGKESVNIPVINLAGDFIRYYLDSIPYCYECHKAFITNAEAERIITRINEGSREYGTIKFEYGNKQRIPKNLDYLSRPTLNNDLAIITPAYENFFNQSSNTELMSLREQSFLGAMGYSVSIDTVTRRRILDIAVHKFGKRKVCDHIAFLMTMRRAQVGGEKKYANALRIWQDDLNYVSSQP